MTLNVAIVFVLFAIRFGPELYSEWKRQRGRRAPVNSEAEKKKLTLKEERALYERMHEARKRQVI
jgi:hypothetical protein